MFQKHIKKTCDIKSFYLDGKFYSQAIFSQINEKTKIDFRNHTGGEMSRSVSFTLPNAVKSKTKKLLDELSLKTAVVDFILSDKDELFFLEINPDGVFDHLSSSCNYNIEKEIADYLYERQDN